MSVAVVITTYNDGPQLGRTLAPLLADPATAELVVVVDGSDDGTFEALRAQAAVDPRLRPFFIENRGRAAAREFALQQVSHDIVLLIDSDVVAVDHRLVSGHARWHETGPPRLVVGYMPIRAPERRPGSFVIEHYARLYELRCQAYERNPQAVLEGLWSGNMSLPRRAIEAAGGFDGGLDVVYSEDTELGLRLARTGLEPVFDRTLLAIHEYERSITGFFATGRQYGEALVRIDAHHPGAIAFPPPAHSRLEARLRRLVVQPHVHSLLLAAGTRLVTGAGRLRAWRAEERLGRLMERIEIEYGMQLGRAALGRRAGG